MKLDALDHPKTLDFAARLDVSLPLAIGHLELLWAFTATKTPHGNIGKWADGAIARGAHWQGDPEVFVQALIDAGFLDLSEKHRLLVHDWAHHSPNWVKAKLRKIDQPFASDDDVSADASAGVRPDVSADDRADDSALSLRARSPRHAMPRDNTSPPLRSGEESPAQPDDPQPAAKANGRSPPCPAEQIVAEYHQRLPQLPRVAKLTDKRRKWLQARWRERGQHQNLEFWQAFFDHVSESPFLLGQNDRGWQADFEWLVNETNFYKTVEGKFHGTG